MIIFLRTKKKKPLLRVAIPKNHRSFYFVSCKKEQRHYNTLLTILKGEYMIQKFFEIFNFRFWLLIIELLYIPTTLMIALAISEWKGSHDEVQ